MAKPNNVKRDSKYMKQQKDRYGENFIGVKTPKELYKEMPRIIAELANGYIDIDTYGYVFLSNQFKQAIMTYLPDQLNLLNIKLEDKVVTFEYCSDNENKEEKKKFYKLFTQ